jgi:DNA polymerase-3 subunit delta
VSPAGLPTTIQDAPDGGVFFLHGPDRFQKEEALQRLVALFLDPATKDFNLDLLRGTEVDVESLARVLATPPMMARFRVVVVREVEALAGSAHARRVLGSLLESTPPGLAVVLEATIPQGSKARFYRDLQSAPHVAGFAEVSPDDVPGWLMARAREVYAVEMEADAARALGAAVGTDLGMLAMELEKLAGMAGESATIDLKVVRAGGTVLPKQDRWRWFDLLGEKRFGDARAGLEILLGQGESAVSLTIGLATHFLRLTVLAELGSRALEEALPRHQQWLARRLQGQARRWTAEELDAAVMELRRVDQLLKSSPLSQQHILEEWILGLTVRAGAAA